MQKTCMEAIQKVALKQQQDKESKIRHVYI